MDEKKSILLVIPVEVHHRLKVEAASKNSTVSAVVRIAIAEHLEHNPGKVLVTEAGQRMLRVKQ
jgi:predicted DNA-binding protein